MNEIDPSVASAAEELSDNEVAHYTALARDRVNATRARERRNAVWRSHAATALVMCLVGVAGARLAPTRTSRPVAAFPVEPERVAVRQGGDLVCPGCLVAQGGRCVDPASCSPGSGRDVTCACAPRARAAPVDCGRLGHDGDIWSEEQQACVPRCTAYLRTCHELERCILDTPQAELSRCEAAHEASVAVGCWADPSPRCR